MNTLVFASVPSLSSSSANGPPSPLVVKPKSRAAFGTASLTIVTFPRFAFVIVQTMLSPLATTKPWTPGMNGAAYR